MTQLGVGGLLKRIATILAVAALLTAGLSSPALAAAGDNIGPNWNNNELVGGCGGVTSGSDVVALQEILVATFYLSPPTADGVFGTSTSNATKNWQRAHGLTADGCVGAAT